MNGVDILRALLMADADVVAAVNGQIMAGTIPVNTVLPAIKISQISANRHPTISQTRENSLITARIQVGVKAKSYAQMADLIFLARLGRSSYSNMQVAGMLVNSVLQAGISPEFIQDDIGLFEQSRDFMVTYQEPQ